MGKDFPVDSLALRTHSEAATGDAEARPIIIAPDPEELTTMRDLFRALKVGRDRGVVYQTLGLVVGVALPVSEVKEASLRDSCFYLIK